MADLRSQDLDHILRHDFIFGIARLRRRIQRVSSSPIKVYIDYGSALFAPPCHQALVDYDLPQPLKE